MLYWSDDVWRVEMRRQIWSGGLFKSPFFSARVTGALQQVARCCFEAVLVSLIVQLAMLPLSIVYFHRVSVISVLLNLWVGSFIAIESFAAVAGAIVGSFSSLLATGFFAIADETNWLMLGLPRLFSDNGWVSFRLPAYTGSGRILYFAYLVPVLVFCVSLFRWDPFRLKPLSRRVVHGLAVTMLAFVAVLLIALGHPLSSPRPDGRLHIEFLDVGQGDSALVTFPHGETLLIDGGGQIGYSGRDEEAEPFQRDVRSIGDAVVSEVLWSKGYSRIDHILATHADADHIQGLVDVAKNFNIGSAVFGRTPPSDPEYVQLENVLAHRGIPVEVISRGETLRFGEAKVEVLYPPRSADQDAISDNDHSVVLRIVFGSRAFLMTGDIERQAESELIGSGTLAADVVKVPHHGSRTSSTEEFVSDSHPEYAVISVGRRSRFGHPHAEVVQRWQATGAQVLTTGDSGMISVSTDGRDLAVERYVR